MKAEAKGKKQMEEKEKGSEKGKRQAKTLLNKGEDPKKLKTDIGPNSIMVSSFNSPSAETGSTQSRRQE